MVQLEPFPNASSEAVAQFLSEFHRQKAEEGLVFYERAKNTQALLDLEISARERDEVIERLEVSDFYKGPRPDKVLIGAEFWEFGKKVKGVDVYIKISLGFPGRSAACLSFHPAERKIKHPYR